MELTPSEIAAMLKDHDKAIVELSHAVTAFKTAVEDFKTTLKDVQVYLKEVPEIKLTLANHIENKKYTDEALKQLMDAHNGKGCRTTEKLEEQIKVANNRIKDLEDDEAFEDFMKTFDGLKTKIVFAIITGLFGSVSGLLMLLFTLIQK